MERPFCGEVFSRKNCHSLPDLVPNLPELCRSDEADGISFWELDGATQLNDYVKRRRDTVCSLAVIITKKATLRKPAVLNLVSWGQVNLTQLSWLK